MTNKTEKDFWIEMSIREISTQAHFANLAYQNIESKANKGNTDAIFSSIHSFLSHCANISKMLKANDGENVPKTTCKCCGYKTPNEEKPSKTIGDILNVSEESQIHKRKFRNHLEHYDDRLKSWMKKWLALQETNPDFDIGTYNVGAKSDFPNTMLVSHYDPSNKIFTFADDDCNISLLHEEANKIKSLADEWVRKIERGAIIPPFDTI